MKNKIQIDEEGFPITQNGLRLDDESFLERIFLSLHRPQGDDRCPLLTNYDGQEIIVTSFDDPLVAQDVLEVGDQTKWRFLGGLEFTCPLDEIKVDEWNRLHAYLGAEKIPAVMSRKVQARFLLYLKGIENFKPQSYRHAKIQRDWNRAYLDQETPWNMNTINPLFEKHSLRLLKESGNEWLIPGAGHGHEITFFESHSKKVTAFDLSPQVKKEFHNLYPESSCDYKVGDFFQSSLKTFDVVIENYFFVALDPAFRQKTIQRIHNLLSSNGFYAGVFFTRSSQEGPPFGLTEWELRAHIKNFFEIKEWIRSPYSHPKRQDMELWVVLQKK
jgi:hypothetical protein